MPHAIGSSRVNVLYSMASIDAQVEDNLEPFRTVNPSAENLAKYFYDEMQRGLQDLPPGARITAATIWETDTSQATYSPAK